MGNHQTRLPLDENTVTTRWSMISNPCDIRDALFSKLRFPSLSVPVFIVCSHNISQGAVGVRVIMITKCFNPRCGMPLRYLRHGRIFRFDLPSVSFEAVGLTQRARIIRKVSHFWLCGHCCQTMTLVSDSVLDVRVQQLNLHAEPLPIHAQLNAIAASAAHV